MQAARIALALSVNVEPGTTDKEAEPEHTRKCDSNIDKKDKNYPMLHIEVGCSPSNTWKKMMPQQI